MGIWLGVQSFINISVNMGLLPTKGLTLPLLSFGGSALLANCSALAILLRIDWENRQTLRGATRYKQDGRRTLIMTGGTGGHIFRQLAVADELKSRGWTLVFLGAEAAWKQTRAAARLYAGNPADARHARQWPAPLAVAAVDAGARIGQRGQCDFRHRPDGVGGVWQLHRLSRRADDPAVVQAAGDSRAELGGRADQPAVVAAGLAPCLPFLRRFRSAGAGGQSGAPAIAAVPAPEARFAGRSGPLRVLVVGGGLGAQALNEALPAALARLPATQRPQVTHQAGAKAIDAEGRLRRRESGDADCRVYRRHGQRIRPGRSGDLPRRCADRGRTGGGGVSGVLVPYPHAVDDHQTSNAVIWLTLALRGWAAG